MSWITLTLRKQTLKSQINSCELQELKLSRSRNAVLREKSYNNSIFKSQQDAELADAKEEYMELREQGRNMDKDSDEYKEWQKEFSFVSEDYKMQKKEIEDYYDTLKTDNEEEATEKENRLDEEQTELESILDALRNEEKSIGDQIKSDIESSTFKP